MAEDIEIDVGETDLAALLAKVEAGANVTLSRDAVPVARVTSLALPQFDSRKVSEAVERIFRARAGIAPTTVEEILAWRDEGRR